MRFTGLTILLILVAFIASAKQSDSTQTVAIDTAEVKQTAKQAIEDSLGRELPPIDSAKLANEVKSTAKQALEDSLGRKIPTIDSAKLVEEVKSTAKQAAQDSLGNYVDVPDIKLDSTVGDQVKSEAKQRLEQETGVKVPQDSAAVKKEATRLAKEQLKEQTGIDAPDVTIDSTTVDQLKDEAKTRAEEAIKDTDEFKALDGQDSELGQVNEMKSELEEKQAMLKQKEARKELKQKMASHAKKYISENAEKIQEVQGKMGELKKKYSYVPNSNDLSTAKKRSSLKGESFWKRLVIGGNFNISKTNPVTIDLSPVIGYKLNKLFEVGITGAYRARFGAGKNGISSYEDEDVYGGSVFANHMAFKNFFGYLEGEYISAVGGTQESNNREWNKTLLLGIGRKFSVAKFLEMQAIVSYNVLHDNSSGVYGSPVVFKTGFRIKK